MALVRPLRPTYKSTWIKHAYLYLDSWIDDKRTHCLTERSLREVKKARKLCVSKHHSCHISPHFYSFLSL